MSAKKKVRVTLDLTPESNRRLEELKKLAGAESKASVLRQALQLYEFIARRSAGGWRFQAVDEEGHEEAVVFVGAVPPAIEADG